MTEKKQERNKKAKITEKMTFAEVVSKYPKTAGVFMRHGMHCVGCPMAMQEKIEEGAIAHGINVKKLLDELNKALK